MIKLVALIYSTSVSVYVGDSLFTFAKPGGSHFHFDNWFPRNLDDGEATLLYRVSKCDI